DWEGKFFGVVGTGVQISTLYEINTTTGVATEIGATPAKAIGGMTMLYDPSTDVEYEPETTVPKDFGLAQNYPNPFNPSTQIKFSLPVVSDVKIDVFNMIGEKITQLIDSEFSAGIHTVEFNSSAFGNLSSGIYIYRITAVGVNGNIYSDSRKMMLIK
ncbi:MAG: T9SS type A sorting domain-containing protein, partial [Melioribacteraceae bacterium]|nr:T9SS type A sorting domain-containing protein [Melioribacteraceae bacterium]